jgi:hypothetical protein
MKVLVESVWAICAMRNLSILRREHRDCDDQHQIQRELTSSALRMEECLEK